MSSKHPSEITSHLRNTFQSSKTRSLEFRIKQLKAFKLMLVENKDKIVRALFEDLHKCKHETFMTEVDVVLNDLKFTLMHLREWDKPERPTKELSNIFDSVYIAPEPYGLVLVIGAWNYPLQVTLTPVIGAIAAGNCVVIKPSELSPNTSTFIAEYFPKYLDSDAYQIYEGGVPETTELLKEKFDYIFYTGSTAIGKIVHAAANKFLTPTTLELGGKNPVYLDKSVDIKLAAKRIMWGKCMNAGQTCLAPDYLICSREIQDKFVTYAKEAVQTFYGTDPKTSPDYGRIVNERHFKRILGLLKGSIVAFGGENDISEKYIAPTVIINTKLTDPIMQEEIFGPILSIVIAENAYEAMQIINSGEKPLAFYIFSNNRNDIKQLMTNTSAGGVTINDTIMHFTVPTLPFGGVGYSGMGSYHGKYTYDTFTHKKSVLHKGTAALPEALSAARYPPYSDGKLRYLQFMLSPSGGINFKCISHLFSFGLGLVALHAYKCIQKLILQKQ